MEDLVFSNLEFLYLFFPLCMLCYFLAKTTSARNIVLIVFSLVFYAWGEPVYIFLMLGTLAVDYLFGLLLERFQGRKLNRLFLTVAMIFNFGLMGIFKYAGFAVESLNGVLGTSIPVPAIALPIGISFYTFQVVSYLIDVFRGEVKAQHEPHKLLLYVSLFHQLIAGPIVRYEHIANEIEHRTVTPSEISMGIDRFIVGLAKKVIIANSAGELAKVYLDSTNIASLSVVALWFGVAMYTIQIYFDFSAYSDMAIGMGRMIGFHYHENFNYPYISRSITDFWRRWHISLSSFFRDYVYIPLGGNRCSKQRHIFNLFVVWGLTGLWHGANWNFVLWGLYFFALLVIEKYLYPIIWKAINDFRESRGLRKWKAPYRILQHAYSLFLIMIGWTLFYYTDFGKLGIALKGMFGLNGNAFSDSLIMGAISNNIFFVIVAIIACCPVLKILKTLYIRVCRLGQSKDGKKGSDVPATIAYIIKGIALAALLFIATAMLAGATYNPFIYTRF